MQDVSASGIKITVIAIPTYPFGITISSFSDDTDPLDIPELQNAEATMGLNGDLIINRYPKPIEINISTIPGTPEAVALMNLLDANRVAKNKVAYQDHITLTVQYPDGTTKVLTNGAIVGGTVMSGVSSNGRLKTLVFKFVFESKVS